MFALFANSVTERHGMANAGAADPVRDVLANADAYTVRKSVCIKKTQVATFI